MTVSLTCGRDALATIGMSVGRTSSVPCHDIIGLARWLEAKRARNGRGISARGPGLTSNEILEGGISGDLQAAEFGREDTIALGGA
jgi:hypothetical protein